MVVAVNTALPDMVRSVVGVMGNPLKRQRRMAMRGFHSAKEACKQHPTKRTGAFGAWTPAK